MGTNERREREKTELRTKIMDAARELFALHGYEAVSMRKIAEKIEYSPTAIYAHFQDKADLLRQICTDDFASFYQRQASVATIADPADRIKAMGRHYIQFAVEHPNHFRRMFLDPPSVELTEECMVSRNDPTQDAYAYFRDAVAQAVQAGRFRDDLTNVELLTQTLWAGVHGVASLAITQNDGWVDLQPLEERVSLMINTLMAGLMRKAGA